ncbi:MAG: hypothetical protein AUG83_04395 [Acidobacteria bacterium 13_1_20CM_4_57_11]|nr:MAG: hypothetical protein AUG83_04395 [Acidobacteria bacterium 13_1_20CM_4_57_11]
MDLDGTLVATDTLWESLLRICRHRPAALLSVLLAICRGKAHFKSVVARNVSLDADRLPYRLDLLRYLREQKTAGRSLVLVTAAHHSIAKAAAAHLSGLFDEVLATTESCNLHGPVKGQVLTEKFGDGGFTYVGNCASDLAVWRHAAAAIPVSARPSVIASIPTPIEATFPAPRHWLHTLSRAVRLHQWVKNLLVLVPLFTSRDLLNLVALDNLLVVALALSLVASAQYLLNDLIDLDSDREHFEKRLRPLASGDLPIPLGLLLVPCLLSLGGWLGFVVGSWTVLMLLGTYFISCLLYSTVLKTKPLVDVFALAGLYVFRIVIGGFVSNHFVTVWLFTFSFLCPPFLRPWVWPVASPRSWCWRYTFIRSPPTNSTSTPLHFGDSCRFVCWYSAGGGYRARETISKRILYGTRSRTVCCGQARRSVRLVTGWQSEAYEPGSR